MFVPVPVSPVNGSCAATPVVIPAPSAYELAPVPYLLLYTSLIRNQLKGVSSACLNLHDLGRVSERPADARVQDQLGLRRTRTLLPPYITLAATSGGIILATRCATVPTVRPGWGRRPRRRRVSAASFSNSSAPRSCISAMLVTL